MEKYIGVKIIKAESCKAWKDDQKNKIGDEGYKVEYEGGYISWSPKKVFEDAYRRISDLTFGLTVEALKMGCIVSRKGWNGKGMFIFKQIPAKIGKDVIPKMQSVPQSVKDLVMKREEPLLGYDNQMAIVHPDGRVDSWVPSSSDIFAEDWEIVE